MESFIFKIFLREREREGQKAGVCGCVLGASVLVCVWVCVCEREREREGERKNQTFFFIWTNVRVHLPSHSSLPERKKPEAKMERGNFCPIYNSIK